MAISQIKYLIFFICLSCIPIYSTYGQSSYKYKVEESPKGLVLTKWKGKEAKINFNNDSLLKRVKIIGAMAFEMNDHIEEVILPEGVEVLEKRAFNTCANLRKIYLPNSIRFIGASAFNMCRNLELSELPSNLEEIGNWAFWDCKKVSISVIPENVKRIGMKAFRLLQHS